MPRIVAYSADRVPHYFPDGTPDAVVDRAMLDYAQSTTRSPYAPGRAPENTEPSFALKHPYDPTVQRQDIPPPPEPGVVETAVDMARVVPGSLVKGVTGLAGMAGDLAAPPKDEAPPANWLQRMSRYIRPGNWMPQSQTMANAVAAPVGGFYESKTLPAKYLETGVEMVPAVVGGPESLALKAARVAVPAIASETAGQLTKGDPIEPYARMGGALIGGVTTGLGEGIAAERRASASTMTRPQIRSTSEALYGAMEAKGLNIAGSSFDTAVSDIENSLASRGINARVPPSAQQRLYPKASAALEVLRRSANGQPISLNDLDKLRQTARVALTGDSADRSVAHAIIDGLDNFVERLGPADIRSGDPAAIAHLTEARSLWARGAKSDVIEDTIRKAEANSIDPAVSKEKAYRDAFKALRRNPRAMRQFTPEETAAINKVVRGGNVANTLRFFGQAAPQGGLVGLKSILTGGAGYGLAGGGVKGAAAAGAVLAGSAAARSLATTATMRNARLASESVRSAGAVIPQLGQAQARQAMLTGMFGARAAQDQQTNQYAARLNAYLPESP